MMTDKQVLEKSSNMTNIERVAEHIARCQHREKVKAALSLLLKPRISITKEQRTRFTNEQNKVMTHDSKNNLETEYPNCEKLAAYLNTFDDPQRLLRAFAALCEPFCDDEKDK